MRIRASYGFKQGEHLSDVLKRAGGFRATAYPEGAVLTRPEVAALEEKSREELIRQIETSSAAARLSPGVSGDHQSETLQLIQQQQEQVLSRLKSQPASGRMVIRINADVANWAGTAADIEVRSGDVLRIPKRPGFVLISGQVYNASAITYAPGKKGIVVPGARRGRDRDCQSQGDLCRFAPMGRWWGGDREDGSIRMSSRPNSIPATSSWFRKRSLALP